MKLSDSALKIVNARYAFDEKEDWQGLSIRVGKEAARYDNSNFSEKFAETIFDGDFLPGGRILRNMGRPRGSLFNCLSKHTEVIRQDGFVKIADLQIGDKILNGNGEFDEIKAVLKNGFKEKLLEINVNGFGNINKILCTEDHRFYVFSFDGGFSWKKADELNEKDFMVIPKIYHDKKVTSININEIVNITELYNKPYDIVDGFIRIRNIGPDAKDVYSKQISPIKNVIEINEDFCKLVGYYLAEGTSIDNGNSILFTFHENEEKYHKEVSSLIEKYFGIKTVIRNNTGKSKQVVANSQILNKFFGNLLGKKCKDKKLPWWWFSLDDKMLLSTLIGAIRGDGRTYFNRDSISLEFTTTNKFLTYQTFLIGVRLNLATSFTGKEGRKIETFGKEYYSDIYSTRFGQTKNNAKLVCGVLDMDCKELDKYGLFSIKSITSVDYNDYVYDISMSNSDSPHFMLANAISHNCYVLPVGDSREEIGQWLRDSLILWGEGGGVGCNISYLRPKGAPIKGVGGSSSGPVSFLEASDAVAKTVESGGSRRAAALATMIVTHPDIMDFIDAKLTHGKLSHYNISVAVTEEFLEAVEKNDDWEFKFAQQSFGKVRAKEIWHKVMDNMVRCAEPGLLNWDNLRSNNSYYFDPVLATNPCGEVPLSSYGVCCLGSLVLPNFITGNINTNWKKLEQTIKLAVRFLDNIIDINKYILQPIEVSARNGRRIGLGVMGLAEYLFCKKLRYGSKKAIDEIEKLMKFIRDVSYEASVELAVEKGAFPKFDPVQYGKAHFIRTLPASLRMMIKDKGIRNVTLMAMAPTGTISLIPEVSSGIEPLFSKAYLRKDRVSERVYIHSLYKQIIESGEETPEWFVDVKDLKPSDHFETQSIIQKYTDGAVSKTINMPKGTTPEDLSRLTLEYIRDLKGVTVYVDESREGQILTHMKDEDVREHINTSKETEQGVSEETVKCKNGTCEL